MEILPVVQARKVYTVAELNRETRLLLSNHFMTVQIEGEISNLSCPASGHIYFSLKDSKAQIRCAMFRPNQRRLRFKPENGQQILATAQVGLYEPRGDFQLVVESMQEAGDGLLRQAFEDLKSKLSDAGLFANDLKQTLPGLPSRIGVVTSPTGAAIKDILSVLKRRFPAIPVLLYPTAVQGKNAKFEITQALENANLRNECDILILARGGGSLEDLWPFNEELVARAIFASKIPIVTGIGHETDTTIADFVADLRAATPSAAAEHLTPDYRDWYQQFIAMESRLTSLLEAKLSQKTKFLNWISKSLQQQRPDKQLQYQMQRLDGLEARNIRALNTVLSNAQQQLTSRSTRLWQFNPQNRISAYHEQQHYLLNRLQRAIVHLVDKHQQQLANISQTLDAVSPLATLNRGYAIVNRQSDNMIVTSCEQLQLKDRVKTRIAKGHFISQIEEIYEP